MVYTSHESWEISHNSTRLGSTFHVRWPNQMMIVDVFDVGYNITRSWLDSFKVCSVLCWHCDVMLTLKSRWHWHHADTDVTLTLWRHKQNQDARFALLWQISRLCSIPFACGHACPTWTPARYITSISFDFATCHDAKSLHCCHFIAVTSLSSLHCCHFIAVTSLLSLHCCHFIGATSLLSLHCCHFIGVTSLLSLHCCHFMLSHIVSHTLWAGGINLRVDDTIRNHRPWAGIQTSWTLKRRPHCGVSRGHITAKYTPHFRLSPLIWWQLDLFTDYEID